jgi:hypothetical protein
MNIKELQVTLLSLNDCWEQRWPGLPLFMNKCLVRLGHPSTSRLAKETQAIHDCIQSVALLIEQDGQARASLNQEPHYHNRLHVANTLVTLTTLLLLQRQCSGDERSIPSHIEWLAMLIMLSHDLLHDGSINRQESQIEARSVAYLKPLMQQHQVDLADQHIIQIIILLTDATLVKAGHEKIKNKPFFIEDMDCLTVLIQEADILASAMPEVGPLLTKQLANEWAKINYHGMSALTTASGRIEFLRHGALFSSPASQLLGINAVKSAQLLALGEDV